MWLRPAGNLLRQRALLVVLTLLLAFESALAQADIPGNIDLGLRELVELNRDALAKGRPGIDLASAEAQLRATGKKTATGAFRLQVDPSNRVLVDVYLAGSAAAPAIENLVVGMGGEVVASDLFYRNGVIAAYLPVEAAQQVARSAAVVSLHLGHRPVNRVGRVTSQGAVVMRSNEANQQGFNGDGVTVGILSDSFNTSGSSDTALSDVRSGDLPNTTAIPRGEGLKFLAELDPKKFGAGTDEGRAMAQVVHDIAPGASLCFATAFAGEVDFANKIRALRTEPACNADVITDDVAYLDEPFFSDGILARAVDEVVTSETLRGNKVSYFSSAGNDARQGYASELRIIADDAARSMLPETLGLNLDTIPADIDTSGGFHNFNPDGDVNVAQDLSFLDGTIISLQWDDAFDLTPSGITTDLNLLFFDPVSGNFLFSLPADSFMTNRPLALFALNTGGGPGTFGELLMVVARTGKGAHLARRIKYVAFGNLIDLSSVITAQTPVTFGHSCARGANSVAASVYDSNPAFDGFTPLYESFSSPGPALIALDADGNRLAHAEVRKKPDIAAVDGVNTTFFPQPFGNNAAANDYEAIFGEPDGFPNFFGTSAAASHAAGIAALVIQKAGGPGSIAPEQVSSILKASAPPRDMDLFYSEAVAADQEATVSVTASGEDTRTAGSGDDFFNISFNSKQPGQTLTAVTIDLTGTGLRFDPERHAVHAGSSTAPAITSVTPNTASSTLTLTFSGFSSGQSLSFGVAREFTSASGKPVESRSASADELAAAKITATLSPANANLSDSVALSGVFVNNLERGYQIYDGFGLIDAVNALKLTVPEVSDDEGMAKALAPRFRALSGRLLKTALLFPFKWTKKSRFESLQPLF